MSRKCDPSDYWAMQTLYRSTHCMDVAVSRIVRSVEYVAPAIRLSGGGTICGRLCRIVRAAQLGDFVAALLHLDRGQTEKRPRASTIVPMGRPCWPICCRYNKAKRKNLTNASRTGTGCHLFRWLYAVEVDVECSNANPQCPNRQLHHPNREVRRPNRQIRRPNGEVRRPNHHLWRPN